MATLAPEQRRLQNREETRRSILDAAETLLLEGGLDAFSMRRLAERCGCTAPTIYHYFRDKPDLIAELLEERLQRLVAELRAAPRSADPVDDVRMLCSAFADFALRHPGHYHLLVLVDGPEPPSIGEAERIMLAPIDELVRRGLLPAHGCDTLRHGLWTLLHGYIGLQTTRPDQDRAPDLLERSLEALLRGSLRAAADGDPS